jgi:hypothetical protein
MFRFVNTMSNEKWSRIFSSEDKGLNGYDFFALPVGRLWFGGFDFYRRAFHKEEGLRLRQLTGKAQGLLPVFVSGNADEFVRDS